MGTREPGIAESAIGARIVIDGRSYVNFGGSSYLGLAANTEIVNAGASALRQYGSGAPLPKLHGIVTRPHQEVESEAAEFFRTESALYLATGYLFGLITIAALRDSFTTICFDESAHYSLREAIAASGLASCVFRHLDAQDLEAKLKQRMRGNDRPLVATDGLFSTWGDIAPLDELAQVVTKYEGRLLVDESHSFGVIGATGRGAVEHHGLSAAEVLNGGSMGKAFGCCGGVIPASHEEVAAFRVTPAALGATAGSPAAAAMCARSLRYVREHPELLQRLRKNIGYMKAGLRKLGLEVTDSMTPVAAFVAGPDKSLSVLRDELMSEGILVYHSTYIGARAGGVIRCGIFADHATEDMDRLFDALRRLL